MFKEFDIDLSGLSKGDISSLQQFVNLLHDGKDDSEAFALSMGDTSDAAKIQARQLSMLNAAYKRGEIDEKAYTAALKNLGLAQKAATLTSKALAYGLNLISNMLATLAVSLVIKGITKLVTHLKEVREEQEKLRKEAAETAKAYLEESSELQKVISQYVEICSTTSDLVSEKEKLLSIQDQIIEKFADEKLQVDLLNDSLTTNLEKLREADYREAIKTIAEQEDQYNKYQDLTWLDVDNAKKVNTDLAYEIINNLEQDFIDDFNAATDYYVRETKNSLGETVFKNADILDVDYSQKRLLIGGDTYADVANNLDLILTKYQLWEGHSTETQIAIEKLREAYQGLADDQEQTVSAMEKAFAIRDGYLNASSESSKKLNDILESAVATKRILDDANSSSLDKFETTLNLREMRSEAYALAGANDSLKASVDRVFANYDAWFNENRESLEEWETSWFDALNDIEKAALKNVDTMKSALQKIVDGEGLTSDEFWELAQYDAEGILNNVQMVGDKFVLTDEQIISLKDQYIQKQIESIKLRQQELMLAKNQADAEIIGYKNLIKEYDERRYGVANLNNPDYRRYLEEQERLKENLDLATAKSKQYAAEWRANNVLIRQYNANLGDTSERLKKLVDDLNSQADDLLKAYETRIDDIIDVLEDEKEALEANRDVLQEQLDLLEEQKENLESIVDDYKTVADVVSDTIQKQIDALKEQNEEREEAIDLAEKLANLENAKNNKVRSYTEAGGWTYEAKKADVQKAEEDLRKSEIDEQIKKLEAYQKKWQNIPNKAQQTADESLADQKLGADWRDKIADQDEDIFKMYETEYDKYCDELYRVSNVEMEKARKSVDAANKEISAKDKEIKKWQEYKSKISEAANEAKKSVEGFYDKAYSISLSMGSDEGEMAKNLDTFYTKYLGIIKDLTEAQNELNESVDGMDFTSYDGRLDDLELRLNRLEANWLGIREDIAQATQKANHQYNSESEGRMHWNEFASGGSATYTGLAMLHGTKQKAETIFNANDSAKLYDLIHNTPNLVASMITNSVSIAKNLKPTPNVDNSGNVTFNNTQINLPNVQNPEQFARQMEMYMQTVLSESQVYKPRR